MPDPNPPNYEVSPTSPEANSGLTNSYGPEPTTYLFSQYPAVPEVKESPSPLYVVPGSKTPVDMEVEKGVPKGRKILGMPAKVFYVLAAVAIAVVVGVAVGVGVGVGTQRAAKAKSPQASSVSLTPDDGPAPTPSVTPISGESDESNNDDDNNNTNDDDDEDSSNNPDETETETPTSTKSTPKTTSTTSPARPTNTFATSGTTGMAHNSCDSAEPGVYTAPDGTRFQQFCHTDWPSTFPAVGGGETGDVHTVTVYTFEACMDRCVEYNARLKEGDTPCAGVTYNSDLGANVKINGGNCWLKDKQGEDQTEGKGTSSSAIIVK